MSNPYRDRLLGVGVLKRGRTRDRVRDVRAADGKIIGKRTTDQASNDVTTYDNRQDVTLRPETVTLAIKQGTVPREC
jgi:hypothetical protein